MSLQLRYFASVREAMGCSQENWSTQARTLGELRDELMQRSPQAAQALDRQRPIRMALNHVMADESQPLVAGAEVAIFPPVTGG
ncbi:molybdopterin converting factor subunit 1 [Curvibacter sp. CHRR-16]|uniref:molybdopterin converting factor subunit 1 n=1 Tax=Curvibacter sp. CHRR-16 TaxID=2835872 RepID=UPI001BDAFD2E|nr:molybdopterin converting factor subunit 1 [Curvibacter sp. CHRR-16]